MVIVIFIVFSTLVFTVVGQPVTLLILAGAFNSYSAVDAGCGIAGIEKKRSELPSPDMDDYLGVIAVLATAIIGVMSLGGLADYGQVN